VRLLGVLLMSKNSVLRSRDQKYKLNRPSGLKIVPHILGQKERAGSRGQGAGEDNWSSCINPLQLKTSKSWRGHGVSGVSVFPYNPPAPHSPHSTPHNRSRFGLGSIQSSVRVQAPTPNY
jgi:hypothetical protein